LKIINFYLKILSRNNYGSSPDRVGKNSSRNGLKSITVRV
jgi:hypothetical protein